MRPSGHTRATTRPKRVGIIVVSNQDTGMFSSLYLVEYDRYAGNQSVRYLDAALAEHELPSGFRVFRVRGELTDDGSDYANSNLYGTVHSQLIELVDPDMDKAHTTGGIDYAPSAVGEDAYGCMLFEESAITPQDTLPPTSSKTRVSDSPA